jgi:uncharacterized protein (TIGR02597 family)
MKTSTAFFKTLGFFVLAGAASLAGLGSVQAQTATTVPEGYITLNIAAGTGSSRALSLLSLPMFDAVPSNIGLTAGIITATSGSTISVGSGSNWTPSILAAATSPYAVKITSGAASGKIFQITANTINTLTVDLEGGDLSGIIVNTDAFEIISLDTLSSVFGTPATTGIQGGTNSATADIVQIISNGVYTYYYYDTDGAGSNPAGWFRTAPPVPSNNVVLRTDKGIIYQRLANAPLSLVLVGRVPFTTYVRTQIKNSGVTLLGSLWPIDTTLETLALQNTPGWVANINPNLADKVQLYISASWRTYFYNGTQWLRTAPQAPSNNVQILAGTAVRVVKSGSTSGNSTLASIRPYNP